MSNWSVCLFAMWAGRFGSFYKLRCRMDFCGLQMWVGLCGQCLSVWRDVVFFKSLAEIFQRMVANYVHLRHCEGGTTEAIREN